MGHQPAYDEPYLWWGPRGRPAAPLSLAELVAAQCLSLPAAGFLAAAVRQGRSIAVVALPSGAGKTTLLNALLPWIPAGRRRLYLRGTYEPFAFLNDPTVLPQNSTLLCNEMSPHLRDYLWGDGVVKTLDAGERGFQILTTAHAIDAAAFVRLLTGPPLRIAPVAVAGFDLVVALDAEGIAPEARRRVSGIWTPPPTDDDIGFVRVGDGDSTLADLSRWVSLGGEVSERQLGDEMIAEAMAEIEAQRREETTAAPVSRWSPPLPNRSSAAARPWRPRRDRLNG